MIFCRRKLPAARSSSCLKISLPCCYLALCLQELLQLSKAVTAVVNGDLPAAGDGDRRLRGENKRTKRRKKSEENSGSIDTENDDHDARGPAGAAEAGDEEGIKETSPPSAASTHDIMLDPRPSGGGEVHPSSPSQAFLAVAEKENESRQKERQGEEPCCYDEEEKEVPVPAGMLVGGDDGDQDDDSGAVPPPPEPGTSTTPPPQPYSSTEQPHPLPPQPNTTAKPVTTSSPATTSTTSSSTSPGGLTTPVDCDPAKHCPPLHVDGPLIKDANDKIIYLKGSNWNTHGKLGTEAFLRYYSMDHVLDQFRAWGLNHVRLGYSRDQIFHSAENLKICRSEQDLRDALPTTIGGNDALFEKCKPPGTAELAQADAETNNKYELWMFDYVNSMSTENKQKLIGWNELPASENRLKSIAKYEEIFGKAPLPLCLLDEMVRQHLQAQKFVMLSQHL
ncbi:unnamed protein product [Amoebophrya sp. A120]|nr:unnamed protein product [Amoebophrya sp. A120]|eukprot:GSA120T00012028001.1